jgi:RND family efflux transporter MFP subunit
MKKLPLIAVTVLLALVAVTGAWKLHQDDAVEVKVITAETGPIKSMIRVTGRVINDRTVTMTALVDGQIQSMLAQKGDHVKAGQTLAYLDKREADALVEKATAMVARERQAVDEAARKWQRLREMSLTGGASAQLVEDSKALWRAAQTGLQVAEAEQRVAQIHREKVEVTAPWDGVIIEKSTEQGQWLEAGVKLFTLVAEEGREIEANVDAGDSGVIKIGQTVTLTCDAFPGHRWNETIHWISPAIVTDKNAVMNSFAIRMTLGPDTPPLLLGQQVDIEIRTAHRDSVLKLPYTALIGSEETAKVAVVHDGKVKYVPVTTGIEDFTHVEIVAGIAPGESIVIFEGKAPMEGSMVKVEPENTQP